MNVIKIQRNAININELIATCYETMWSSLVARYFALIISVKSCCYSNSKFNHQVRLYHPYTIR